ncbi:MAG TPA: serine hydrolase [Planctomycetaceae bacterium]|nr:serine hydrolase [Planctomycetaceae bacterium]
MKRLTPLRLSKTGTGSELEAIVRTEFAWPRGACPLFRHAAIRIWLLAVAVLLTSRCSTLAAESPTSESTTQSERIVSDLNPDRSSPELSIALAETIQPPIPTDYSPVIATLRAAVRYEVEQKKLPAFSISIVDDDQVIWADGFGFQDAAQKIPATANSVYRVGSISKLFTDLAVLQLVEEGKLDLDAPIQKYLPDFKPQNPYAIPLTLRQMMSHRSGLVRESPVGNYFDPEEPTLEQTVASLNQTALVYKPETKTKYSNAAIAVVGAVLEKQLDVSHPERVRQSILDPLGMRESSFVVTPEVRPHLATGWMRTYDARRFEAPDFLLGTGPAGNLYSSVLDLSKFLSCIFAEGKSPDGRRIITPEVLRLMSTPIEDADGKPQGFGLGFHVQDLDGYKKIGHGGAVYGFSTQLEALPERKLGVAAVSSLDGTNGVVRRLTDFALRLMIAQQDGKPLPSYRTTGPIPAERARELIGTYREAEGQRFTHITELNGDVFMQRGEFRYELRAAADDGTILTDDSVGFGTEVNLEDADRLVVGGTAFQRVPNDPPADIPDRWKGLIGEYGWDHNTLYILEDQGQLYALIEWFYYYPLQEVSENEFEFPDYGLYHGEGLQFTRNTEGNATEVVAAEVIFVRREVGTKDGETFKITPVKPIDELRTGALAASPPEEKGEYRKPDLVELVSLDPTIKLDIRYASTNNFTGALFYKQPLAFMQRPAAEAVVRANKQLKEQGLGLLIHDAYRPWHVTKMFWDATPDELKDFVANPANGSRHNRGCAVDLTLYDLSTGEPIQMVAGYDEFSPRSFPLYPGGTSRQRWYRELLRRTMEAEGFTIYEFEWWHFDFADWKKYRIGNVTFEEVLGR